MYIRLHNSCTYFIYEEYFEIRSDVFGLLFRFKGIQARSAENMLKHLQEGVQEETVIKSLLGNGDCSEKKVAELINFLDKRGLLVRRKNLINFSLQDTLYDRQIRFLDTFEDEVSSGFDFNKRLQDRKVAIVGLGAYGSWLALHCARLGIKNIIGIDFDIVEQSNLHRQILYTQNDVGSSKTTACKKLLTSVDSSIRYEGRFQKIGDENDLIPILDGVDLIFNAFGYYPAEEAVNMIPGFIAKACIKKKTPMLCLSTSWVGPFYIPDQSACYFCAVEHPALSEAIRKNIRNPRVDKRAFCPLLSISCSIAILEAARFLSGINQPQTIEGILALDPFKIDSSSFVPIRASKNCAYCSS